MITKQQKSHVKQLIKEGQSIAAVKYLMENFNINLQQAKLLVDQLNAELKGEVVDDIREKFKSKSKIPMFIGGLFGFIGLIFLAVSTIIYVSDSNFKKTAVKVTGIVVSQPHQPLIEYQFEGQAFSYQATTNSNPPSYHIGEIVDIFINPQNPHEALIDNFLEGYFVLTLFGGLGFVFFMVGSALFFSSRR